MPSPDQSIAGMSINAVAAATGSWIYLKQPATKFACQYTVTGSTKAVLRLQGSIDGVHAVNLGSAATTSGTTSSSTSSTGASTKAPYNMAARSSVFAATSAIPYTRVRAVCTTLAQASTLSTSSTSAERVVAWVTGI